MKKKKYFLGFLKIRPTNNNIFVTLVNSQGGVIAKTSAGVAGFSGKKKVTGFVAGQAIYKLIKILKAKQIFITSLIVEIYNYPTTPKAYSIVTALRRSRLNIMEIQFLLKYCHNGMKTKKVRRK